MNWKAPKSVRQIGDITGRTKIYVEDYVTSFARRLSKERNGAEQGGVLLGHRFYHAGEKVFLVSGMVSIKEFHKRSSDIFSKEMWTDIYTDIKENFTDLDVVGWYYTGRNGSGGKEDRLLEIHRRNFSEGDRLLYIYEENGGEDDFYLYENGGFAKQKGYYIYYEKNPEMRHYMMEEANRFVHIVEQEDDRVLRNIRGVIRENEEKKKAKDAEGKWSYALASLVVVLGLVLGMVAVANRNGLAELKDQMAGLQTAIMGEKEDKTTVETIGGGVVSGASVGMSPASGGAVSGAPVEAAALPAGPVSGGGVN
ncbi:MAG: hypothetical protein NC293_10370 [Roseburia sp.]|nr:hypothetical protein [Roseburia sp.]